MVQFPNSNKTLTKTSTLEDGTSSLDIRIFPMNMQTVARLLMPFSPTITSQLTMLSTSLTIISGLGEISSLLASARCPRSPQDYSMCASFGLLLGLDTWSWTLTTPVTQSYTIVMPFLAVHIKMSTFGFCQGHPWRSTQPHGLPSKRRCSPLLNQGYQSIPQQFSTIF